MNHYQEEAGIEQDRDVESEGTTDGPDGYWKDRLLHLFGDVLCEGPPELKIKTEDEMEIVQCALPGLFG